MRVAIIGAGLQGWRRARALSAIEGDVLAAVVDVNLTAAERLAASLGGRPLSDWRQAVEEPDIDVVITCTPPRLHASVSILALRSGKHLLCEKPLGLNVAEAERIVDAGRSAGRLLKCGFNHRHHPAITQARRWVDEGLIGEAPYVLCRHGIGGRAGYEREWRANPEISGGGQLMDQGLHGLDLARWFLGEFTEAAGMIGTFFWDVAPLEDNAFVLLRTAEGKVASLHASWTQWRNLFQLEIYGREGYVRVEGLGGSYGTERVALGRRDFDAPFAEQVVEYRGEDSSCNAEWREFKDAIAGRREPLASGRDGLEAIRLVEAVYRSARNRRFSPIA